MLTVQKCFNFASPFKICAELSANVRGVKTRVVPRGRVQNKLVTRRGPRSFDDNPGVQRQMTAMGLPENELRDPNLLEEFETQFWDADKVQDIVDKERHIEENLMGIFQVMRKQYKEEASPNMLTWDEKQEIKALHAQDPEEWSIMKLAYSYPASPSIIKKVLRANWKLRTSTDIHKHDQKVKRNWEALSKGQLKVPDEDLRKHLMTFTNRSKTPLHESKDIVQMGSTTEDPYELKGILKDGGVFGNIYQSYKRTNKVDSNQNKDRKDEKRTYIEEGLATLYQPPINDTFIVPEKAGKFKLRTLNHMTLDAMKTRVSNEPHDDEEQFSASERSLKQSNFQEQLNTDEIHKSLVDPIGTHSKEDLLKNNIDYSDEKGKIPPLQQTNDLEHKTGNSEVYLHSVNENTDSNFSTTQSVKKSQNLGDLYDIPRTSPYEGIEDKELLARFETARVERSKYDSQIITKAVKDYVSQSSDSYPLEIEIPKDLWRKGAIYRVKDRFYADDGEFLYRVPGLVKE